MIKIALTNKIVNERIGIFSNNQVVLNSEFENSKKPILLKCLKCGNVWSKLLHDYIKTSNRAICPICNNGYKKLSKKEVQKRIRNILGEGYILIGDYINNITEISIKHLKCNSEYKILPVSVFHRGNGKCRKCYPKDSLGSLKIKKYLNEKKIKFETEKKFKNCFGESKFLLPFDFYIKDFNLIIEFDGEQHFKPKFGEDWNGTEFNRTKKNDEIKNNFCKKQKIQLIRIPYNYVNNITTILDKTFNDYRKQI